MKVPERGVVYKASARAFMGNYLIALGVLILGFLVVGRFDLVFDISPTSLFGILGTLTYIGFIGVALYLFLEFLFEGLMRRYVVSNNEIIKIEGLLVVRRYTIPYQSIAEVRVTRGPFGRIFNYGTVDVVAFGDSGGVGMTHMTNPEEIQRLIQHKVNLMRTTMTEKRRTKSRYQEDKEDGDVE
jgi:membrane protein YdbS with pleckstrin-like domain